MWLSSLGNFCCMSNLDFRLVLFCLLLIVSVCLLSREISKEEFKKVMALMRAHNRQGAVHKNGRRTVLKVSGSVENGGLVEYFFDKDGNGRLHHDKFVLFLRDLHDEVNLYPPLYLLNTI